jgi:hypothetical protein
MAALGPLSGLLEVFSELELVVANFIELRKRLQKNNKKKIENRQHIYGQKDWQVLTGI